MGKIKELLKGKLTQKEIELVPSSFDVVGSILIFSDFPKGLVKKEKIIAQTILKQMNNIKTVCKKTGKYSGTYRTPKLKILAGEKTKETTYKESGISLKLDVEKIYFSSRSGNERLRIAKQVKNGEDVLVMFSGCAPFPCVIAKNSKAKSITGVEINPIAHKYAIENINTNKLTNVILFQGDVNDILPRLGYEGIALKSRPTRKHLAPKLKLNPQILEFFIPNNDLNSKTKIKKIESTIKDLNNKGIKVMLHMPHLHSKEYISLAIDPKKIKSTIACMKILNNLVEKNENCLGYVMHVSYHADQPNVYKEDWLFKNYEKVERLGLTDNMYLENCNNLPFGTKKNILNFIKKTGLKNMCLDYAHFMRTNQALTVQDIKDISSKVNVYHHIINFKYKKSKHCARLREGSLDMKKVAPLVKFGCVEVYSKNEVEAKEQISDYKYFLSLMPEQKFDRILMPLPKSAEDYLDIALTKAKKGTTIHFYDFLNEDEFDLGKEKVEKACKKAKKKFKILKIVKCGHFGPKVFRVSVDFKIL